MASTLKQKLQTGLRWSVMRQAVTAAVGSLGALAYTRFLQPEDLGAFTLALIVYSGLLLLVQIPFRDAVIYFQDSETDQASAAFWLLLGFALAATGAVIGGAGLLGAIYESELAVPLTRAITLAFLFQALAVVPAATMLKQFRFPLHETLGTITYFILLGGWLYLAPRGFGAWTLVYPQIAAAAFYATMVWLLAGFRPRWRIGRTPYLEVLRYSRALLGSKLTIYLQRNLDNAIIGRFGAQTLGWYTFGEEQSTAIVMGVGQTIAQITLPALAAVRDKMTEVRTILSAMFRLAATAALPAHVGALLLADIGVELFFGAQWMGGVAILRAYLIFRAAETFAVICDSATSAIGQPQLRFRIDLLQLPVFALGLLLGFFWSRDIVDIAGILALIRLGAMVIYIRWTLTATELAVTDFGQGVWPAGLAALLMGLGVFWLRGGLTWTGSPRHDGPRLLLVMVLAGLIYTPLLYRFDPTGFRATYWLTLAIMLPASWSERLSQRWPGLKRFLINPEAAPL